MPAWEKIKGRAASFSVWRGPRQAGLGLGLALLAGLAFGKGIAVQSIHTYLENNVYYLDANFNIELSPEAERALRHGIALEIHTEFQLLAERTWLWDKKISASTLKYRLQHRPLTGDYLSVNLRTGQRLGYNSLTAALNAIGAIRKMALFEDNMLTRDARCYARIRGYLDLASLPAPLRPQAYFSADWNMAGPWHKWQIAR